MATKKDIINQLSFCDELYSRLKNDIQKTLEKETNITLTYGIRGYSRMENDIIRLRKELLTLSKQIACKGE